MRTLMTAGNRYGRLEAIAFEGRQSDGRALWRFKCDCGNSVAAVPKEVRRGHTRSCGCLQREKRDSGNPKHGHAHKGAVSSEYVIWCGIIARCENPNEIAFKWYGARGISMCAEWRSSFATFLSDVGRRPSSNHSIDRIDVNDGYHPGNVRWATNKQQARNKRSNRLVRLGEEIVCEEEAAEKLGVTREYVRYRIKHGIELVAPNRQSSL